jgi:hypothetical protein
MGHLDIAGASDKRSTDSGILDELHELDLFTLVGQSGLGWALEVKRVHAVVQQYRKDEERDKRPIEVQERELSEIEAFGKRQSELGFPYLFALAAIRLASMLENHVQALLVERLRQSDPASWGARLKNVRGPLADLVGLSREDQAEVLADAMAQLLTRAERVGIGRYEGLLAEVGLGGSVDPEIRSAIHELVEIRNVLVHRGGRVDAQVVERGASCGWALGERVNVSHRLYRRWLVAVQGYVFVLVARTARLVPGSYQGELKEVDDGVLEHIQGLRRIGKPPWPSGIDEFKT